MSGTIPLSLSQQFDKYGKPLSGGKLYIIQAGTVSTPQVAYQDGALTIPYPGGSILTLDAAGRIGQFFLADGLIKIRLTDKNGIVQLEADGIQVIGPSSGGGGGGSVDPTTILQTGDFKVRYGVGVISGFVRMNGRTIGSATSGATERANADTQALFGFLWEGDTNLPVSGGRGASSAADWNANKQISLPDWRGYALGALADMGNSATTVLTSAYFGGSPIILGAGGGNQSWVLTEGQLPALTKNLSGQFGTISVLTTRDDIAYGGGAGIQTTGLNNGIFPITHFASSNAGVATILSQGNYTPSGTVSFGGSGAHPLVQPTKLATFYLKL